jgi:hypothetical protein
MDSPIRQTEPSPVRAIFCYDVRDGARHARATIDTDKISDAPIAYSERMRVNEDERVAQRPFINGLAI